MYSFPQICHDDKNKSPDRSDPPRSLRPRVLCLASIEADLSFVMDPPISALGTSVPHWTLLNKSAADTFGDNCQIPLRIDKQKNPMINDLSIVIKNLLLLCTPFGMRFVQQTKELCPERHVHVNSKTRGLVYRAVIFVM